MQDNQLTIVWNGDNEAFQRLVSGTRKLIEAECEGRQENHLLAELKVNEVAPELFHAA